MLRYVAQSLSYCLTEASPWYIFFLMDAENTPAIHVADVSIIFTI